MTSELPCGPCSSTNKLKDAENWCTNCGEGFCCDCELVHRSMKATKSHKLISTEVYRKIENVPVNLECGCHDKNFDYYCRTHDVEICVECVAAEHTSCSEVISLDEAAADSKISSDLDEVLNLIFSTLQFNKYLIDSRNKEMQTIKQQEERVTTSIRQMRSNINKHLDELQKKLLDEFSNRCVNCESKYGNVLEHLTKTEKEIKLLQEQILQLKLHGSNLHVFLGTLQIKRLIRDKVQTIESVTNVMRDYTIGVEIKPEIISILKNVDTFGKINVDEHTTSLSFDLTRLQMRQKFKIRGKGREDEMSVSGCSILPNGHLLITDYYAGDKVVMEYSNDGKHIRDIPLSHKTYDLHVIDEDRIAVIHPETLQVLNIKENKVEKEIYLIPCFGVSYQNGKCYTVSEREGILEIDMQTKGYISINGKYSSDYTSHLSTTKDRIYCTTWDKSVVNCCSMTGEDIWSFADKSLENPHGISLDGDQNIFVAGYGSNNLVMIRHDGKVCRSLLTSSDGLNKPRSLHYNKDKKLLLVCNNYDGQAFLYDVICAA